MASDRKIRVAAIGVGSLGRHHARNYAELAHEGRVEFVGACDTDAETAKRIARENGAAHFTDWRDLLDKVDAVSIATPTETHAEIACAFLEAGKHVLVEKPVSLDPEEIARLESAAASAGRLCMPAMCMRFWPGWDWLYDRIRDRSLGVLRSISLTRLGSGPSWASEFYRDVARSGGALVDLHIHDADFACWCFGRPNAVSSAGDEMHVTTHYHFTSGPNHVVAEGAWDLAPASGFRMRYLANFEQATAEFDISRTPWLRLHRAAGSEDIALLQGTGYDGEIRHLVSNISAGSSALRATLADAALVARVLEAERRSQRTRQPVEV